MDLAECELFREQFDYSAILDHPKSVCFKGKLDIKTDENLAEFRKNYSNKLLYKDYGNFTIVIVTR